MWTISGLNPGRFTRSTSHPALSSFLNSSLASEEDLCHLELIPQALLSGHESSVSAICDCVYDLGPSACSASTDGTLAVWNMADGRCMAITRFLLSGSPLCIQPLPGGTHIAASGRHCNIEIVDLQSQKIVKTLDGHTEWVPSLSVGINLPNNSAPFSTTTTSAAASSSLMMMMTSQKTTAVAPSPSQSPNTITTPATPTSGTTPNPSSMVPPLPPSNYSSTLLVSVSKDSTLKYRSFTGLTSGPPSPPTTTTTGSSAITPSPDFEPVLSVDCRTKFPRMVSRSPDWKWVLVVSNKKISIFPFRSVTPQWRFSISGKTLHGGFWLDSLHFLIWSQDGDGFVFELPNGNTLAQSGSGSGSGGGGGLSQSYEHHLSISLAIERALNTSLIGGVSSVATDGAPISRQRVETNSEPKMIQFLSFSSNPHETLSEEAGDDSILDSRAEHNLNNDFYWSFEQHSNIVARADSLNGNVRCGIWDPLENQIKKMQDLEFSLEEEWNAMTESPAELHDKITASSFIIEANKSPTVILGYLTGSIKTFRAEDRNTPERVMLGHREMITCLLVARSDKSCCTDNADRCNDSECPHEMTSHRRFLVSGSSDFSVKVWDIDTGRLLKSFHYHSGVVTCLTIPPKAVRQRFGKCFVSIGDDGSVVLYSLSKLERIYVFGGHSSTITSLNWMTGVDSLFVRCLDGNVYVWQLSTGFLEKIISGPTAASYIERTEGPGSIRTVKTSISGKTIYFLKENVSLPKETQPGTVQKKEKWWTSSVDLGCIPVADGEPDIPILMVSIRRLVLLIQSEKALLEESINQGRGLPSILKHFVGFILNIEQGCPRKKLLRTIPDPHLLDFLREEILKISHKEKDIFERVSLGLKGAKNTFTLSSPRFSEMGHNPFAMSSIVTSLLLISAVSILNALGSLNIQPGLFSRVVPEGETWRGLCLRVSNYFLRTLPTVVEHFEEGSFLWCVQFLKDQGDVNMAAKMLMSSLVERMNLSQVTTLSEKLAEFLNASHQSGLSDEKSATRKANLVIGLSYLVVTNSKHISHRICALATQHLLSLASHTCHQQVTAIKLLADFSQIWIIFIYDKYSVIRMLYGLASPRLIPSLDKSAATPNPATHPVACEATNCLAEIASLDAALFVKFLTDNLTEHFEKSKHSPRDLIGYVSAINPVVQKNPSSLIPHLVQICSNLVKILDPHFPTIRDAAMVIATNTLRYLVRIYPMVSFHQERQKFAVGNEEGYVVIFEMRTASKWHSFQAHPGTIDALGFSPTGEYLATFSTHDNILKVWTVESTGVFLLLGISSRPTKHFQIKDATRLAPKDVVAYIRIEWEAPKEVSLRYGKNSPKKKFSV